MKTGSNRTIHCPACRKGRILDAAAWADMDRLRLYGPRQLSKAEWFTKCPKCGVQIGIAFRKEVNTEQQRAGA